MTQTPKPQEQKPKPKTPPALDVAIKRIFAYGPSRKRGKGEDESHPRAG